VTIDVIGTMTSIDICRERFTTAIFLDSCITSKSGDEKKFSERQPYLVVWIDEMHRSRIDDDVARTLSAALMATFARMLRGAEGHSCATTNS
jgi:hypothetical protein